jgi:DNA-binding NarL/FixJ family response regulator
MRILLADDEARVCSALKLMLEHQPGLQVVGEVGEAHSLLAEVRATQPDLLLVDWELPGLPASTLFPALRDLVPTLIIVVLSSRPHVSHAAALAGADAFVSKVDPPEKVLAAVRQYSLSPDG